MTDLIYRPPTRKLNFTVNVFRTMEEIKRSREEYEKNLRTVEKKVLEKRIEDLKRLRRLVGKRGMRDKNNKARLGALFADIQDDARRMNLKDDLDVDGDLIDVDDLYDAQRLRDLDGLLTDEEKISRYGLIKEAEDAWHSDAAERAREDRIAAAAAAKDAARTDSQQKYREWAPVNERKNQLVNRIKELDIQLNGRTEELRSLEETQRQMIAAGLEVTDDWIATNITPIRQQIHQLGLRLDNLNEQLEEIEEDWYEKRRAATTASTNLQEAERAWKATIETVNLERKVAQTHYEQLKEEADILAKADYTNYRLSLCNFALERGAEYSEDRKELEVRFPDEFVKSQNRRFVSVISIRAVQMRRRFNIPFYERLLLTPAQKDSALQKLDDLRDGDHVTEEERNKVLTAASKDDALGVLDVLIPERDKTKPLPTLSEISRIKVRERYPENTDVLNPTERRNVTLQSWDEYIPDIYTLHCTFVHDQYNDDYTVAFLNEPLLTPRKYEQYQNQPAFKLWVADETDNSEEPFANRVDLMYPVKSFLKLLKFKEMEDDVWNTMLRLYSYVLIIQMELEF